jgi:hypothetical protein
MENGVTLTKEDKFLISFLDTRVLLQFYFQTFIAFKNWYVNKHYNCQEVFLSYIDYTLYGRLYVD